MDKIKRIFKEKIIKRINEIDNNGNLSYSLATQINNIKRLDKKVTLAEVLEELEAKHIKTSDNQRFNGEYVKTIICETYLLAFDMFLNSIDEIEQED